MELLTGTALRRRLRNQPPLIEDLRDPEVQIQMNGVDLTLAEVHAFGSDGPPVRVDFDNSARRLPETVPLEERREGGWRLAPGAWWIRYREVVHIPPDVFAIGRTRSSLLRGGAQVGTAVWDSGYSGRSGSLLTVHHPAGLELAPDARVMQLLFFQLSRPAERLYAGIFQNE